MLSEMSDIQLKAREMFNGRYTIYPDGRIISRWRNNTLKPKDNGRGYLTVCIWDGEMKRNFYVHRLVAQAHLLNESNKPCVNHRDGDKSNNRVENLEWCTYAENEQHSYKSLGKKPSMGMLGKVGRLCKTSRPVRQYTLAGVFVTEHESCRQAGEAIKSNYKNIWNAAAGIYQSSAGYKWRFADGLG